VLREAARDRRRVGRVHVLLLFEAGALVREVKREARRRRAVVPRAVPGLARVDQARTARHLRRHGLRLGPTGYRSTGATAAAAAAATTTTIFVITPSCWRRPGVRSGHDPRRAPRRGESAVQRPNGRHGEDQAPAGTTILVSLVLLILLIILSHVVALSFSPPLRLLLARARRGSSLAVAPVRSEPAAAEVEQGQVAVAMEPLVSGPRLLRNRHGELQLKRERCHRRRADAAASAAAAVAAAPAAAAAAAGTPSASRSGVSLPLGPWRRRVVGFRPRPLGGALEVKVPLRGQGTP
jgi:hypothetical protein